MPSGTEAARLRGDAAESAMASVGGRVSRKSGRCSFSPRRRVRRSWRELVGCDRRRRIRRRRPPSPMFRRERARNDRSAARARRCCAVAAADGRVRSPADDSSRRSRNGGGAASFAGLGIALTIAAIAAWLAYRPLAGGPQRLGPKPGSSKASRQTVGDDTASPWFATRRSTRVRCSRMTPDVTNPEDSAQAAAFGVELLAANTQAGAILKLQKDGKTLPAATFAPALIQGAQMVQGHRRRVQGSRPARIHFSTCSGAATCWTGNGAVVRLPSLFSSIQASPASAVPGMVAMYADRGQPVYALRQAEWNCVVARSAPSSRRSSRRCMLRSLRASGITPVLVYRKGRAF